MVPLATNSAASLPVIAAAASFEAADGRIAFARVVAEFGAAHRLAHLLGRQRHGVASQVDHGSFPS